LRRIVSAIATLGALTAYATHAAGRGGEAAAIKIPEGYRDWRLVAVAHEEGMLNDLRAILGNDIAIKAAREGQAAYPDGAVIARLAWNYAPLAESEKAFGHAQSFVAGTPKNGVQFMIRDASKYAATGGWGFFQFDDDRPASEAAPGACFSCHETVKARGFVFNRYAP
jgi:Cytochrome P460